MRTGRSKRVPVVLQTSAADCGAACLTMILRHHGCTTTLREVRRQVGVSRDGSTALALIEVGRQYGLCARAFSVTPADLARLPSAVVHWQFNHFMVLQRWTPKAVQINDPAVGRRRITCEEFDAGFTGVVMVFTSGDQFRPSRPASHPHPWHRQFLRSVILHHRSLWGQVLGASLALQVLGLLLPFVTQVIVDHALRRPGTTLLHTLGLGMVFAALCQFVLCWLRNGLLVSLRVRADAELTTGVIRHLLLLPYSFFCERGSSDLVMRTASVSTIREMITLNILPAVLDGPLAFGYFVLVLARDPVLGAVLAAVAAMEIGILLGTRRRISELTHQELVTQTSAQGYLMEAIKGIETLKAMGAEERVMNHWSGRFVKQLNTTVCAGKTIGLVDATLSSFRAVVPVTLVLVGAWRVTHGALSLGAMLGLTAVATAALAPLSSLASSLQLLQSAGAHLERLTDIIDTEPDRATGATARGTRMGGRIEARGIGFRHSVRAPWILRGISFTVLPGQKIAIIGRSGSGKSTLARMLLGIQPPSEGQICFDGIPAEDMGSAWRSQVGVVTQDPALFTGTIRENITLGDPGASLDRVVAAARLACIHDDITQLPMRYETLLSEGNGLSGGQRQRVALARALLTEPVILVLDEATSQVDTETEAAIEVNLSGLPQTRIVIAHRMSTVRNADMIVVLDSGGIAECGTHDKLLALNGYYARLIAHQEPHECSSRLLPELS
jgi:ATP-binding cassette subfamily B protein